MINEYYIQNDNDTPKLISKSEYEYYTKGAGFWLGDNKLISSFYDVQTGIKGWVEDMSKFCKLEKG